MLIPDGFFFFWASYLGITKDSISARLCLEKKDARLLRDSTLEWFDNFLCTSEYWNVNLVKWLGKKKEKRYNFHEIYTLKNQTLNT